MIYQVVKKGKTRHLRQDGKKAAQQSIARLREPHNPDKMPDITVKTMKGEQFPVTVDDGATVMNLAEKIAEKKPEMEPGSMKLIYAGKILAMDNKLSESSRLLRCSKIRHRGGSAPADRAKDDRRPTLRAFSRKTLVEIHRSALTTVLSFELFTQR